jgi:hypothetical protein
MPQDLGTVTLRPGQTIRVNGGTLTEPLRVTKNKTWARLTAPGVYDPAGDPVPIPTPSTGGLLLLLRG